VDNHFGENSWKTFFYDPYINNLEHTFTLQVKLGQNNELFFEAVKGLLVEVLGFVEPDLVVCPIRDRKEVCATPFY